MNKLFQYTHKYKMLFLLIAIATVNAKITDCSSGKSLFNIDGLGFWPDPAQKNANSTVSFAFTVPEPGVTSGTATTSVTYNFIPLQPTVDDLCTQTNCPIVPGPHNMSTSSIFPDLVGSLVIKFDWKDSNGAQLLCASINTKSA